MDNDVYLHYWCDLYPNKDSYDNFLFEITKNDLREEYYFRDNDQFDYESYTINSENELVKSLILSQKEMLKIVKETKKEYWAKNINIEPTSFQSQIERSFQTNYIRHKMFVAADYKTIIKILLDTLTEKQYYEYSSESDGAALIDTSKYLSAGNPDPDRFSIISYMFRTEYNEGYPGCLVSVCNLPYKISKLADLDEPLYDWVFEKLEEIPCVVEFEFNYRSHFSFGSSVNNSYITPFYLELCKNNIRSVLFSIDDEFFYIKTNFLLSDNERLQKLDFCTGKIIDPLYKEKLIQNAQNILGKYWDDLSPVSKLSFPRGLDLYKTDKLYNGDILDSSPASIQFAKCIETEIEQKLLLPFRNYFNGSEFINFDLSNDLRDTQVSRMTNFLIKPDSKAPELGTFAFFLSTVINSKSRVKTSNTIKSYLQHILVYQNSDFLISKEFNDTLNLISTKYRNGAAHTKALPYSSLVEFYKELIGENQNGFIFRLLDSLRKK
jgi:hypothetical protein